MLVLKWVIFQKNKLVASISFKFFDKIRGIGEVVVHNQHCKTIGNVCMDMTMIDVTNIPGEVGDEVIILGTNPTINELAKKRETTPYEVLTVVSERVKRFFIRNKKTHYTL